MQFKQVLVSSKTATSVSKRQMLHASFDIQSGHWQRISALAVLCFVSFSIFKSVSMNICYRLFFQVLNDQTLGYYMFVPASKHFHAEQSGAAEACWAHNPEVDGSKPSSANYRCWIKAPVSQEVYVQIPPLPFHSTLPRSLFMEENV